MMFMMVNSGQERLVGARSRRPCSSLPIVPPYFGARIEVLRLLGKH